MTPRLRTFALLRLRLDNSYIETAERSLDEKVFDLAPEDDVGPDLPMGEDPLAKRIRVATDHNTQRGHLSDPERFELDFEGERLGAGLGLSTHARNWRTSCTHIAHRGFSRGRRRCVQQCVWGRRVHRH